MAFLDLSTFCIYLPHPCNNLWLEKKSKIKNDHTSEWLMNRIDESLVHCLRNLSIFRRVQLRERVNGLSPKMFRRVQLREKVNGLSPIM